jgi:hypothetical protein
MQVTNALYFHALYVRMPELCNKYNTPHLQDMLLSLKVKKAEHGAKYLWHLICL